MGECAAPNGAAEQLVPPRGAALDGKNVFQCFWSDPKARAFECFWVSLPPPQPPCVFQYLGDWLKTRVFYCFSEALYCFCHLGVLPAAAARSWQHLKEERDAQNDETTL